ncbi:MAG: hypothetical protein ACFFCD_15065 [Promethearchaeota archaeon]
MNSKLLIIIATGNKEKALAGLMYARNAMKRGWMEDVKVVFFGPSERLIIQDAQVLTEVQDITESEEPLACKAISDREGISEDLKKFGVKVEYVGSIISDLIKDGYLPMVW